MNFEGQRFSEWGPGSRRGEERRRRGEEERRRGV
jgi:hypothetical protein